MGEQPRTPLLIRPTIRLKVSAIDNVAVAGKTTAQLITDALTKVDPLFVSGKRNIVIFWEGTNDLGNNHDPTTTYNNIVTYCNARRAAGFKVIVLTIIARNVNAQFEADRLMVNANLRANWTTFADGLVDVGADSRFQNPLDGNIYTDGTHLTTLGNQAIAQLVATG